MTTLKTWLFISTLSLATTILASSFDHSHDKWTKLLKTYLTPEGNVRYAAWKKNTSDLDSYLKNLKNVSYKSYQSWTPDQKKAYLINAYNAFTIRLILNHYPVDSIKDIGSLFSSPWKKDFFSILDGRITSLDPIEHDWLRKKPELKDPRVHAAVNCASISCPPLRNEAFDANRIEAQLNDSTQAWLKDSSRNQFKKGKAELSKIFDWFDEDFGGNDKGVLAFIEKHSPELRKILGKDPSISYLSYDWGLNKAP
ncbi:DUF547 domain-containing protein [Pseudobacteriovorax antillogorgiicola]|uniref:DUF547 domain-containing protein n=1 Tax=Pseudobacteriovorax antillogorgiicola TaxID=1513793 RepID=A0A1Y6CN77_9BACT|nr:DUF547 domain-containing protein [Pseudobacteriovorax antillogorgiicola]TCS44978.1 uncharacterized protein DUF547 [Pseudobacteriovorax antillogorgiicola]SMF76737.1 Protein of unknown function, DUF547 [Pseudobacteriovorax antillogorgiicola]